MKFRIALFAVLLAFVPLHAKNGKLIVGATPEPHAIMLEQIVAPLKEQGVTLEIREFNDYVIPNMALDDGSIDVNFFQHKPYLDSFNREKGTKLIAIAAIHLEPMGVYSEKIKNLKELKNGATIAIPNDPSNGARALRILEKQGLIALKSGDLISVTDITKNPHKLRFKELDAPQLPRVLPEVDAAIINTNFAMLANLNPLKDAIALESTDSPYANVVVVKSGNENDPDIVKFVKTLQSDFMRDFINKHYNGAILPSF